MSRKKPTVMRNKKMLLVCLIAGVVCATLQTFPYFGQIISFSVMMLIPSMYVFVVVPWLVAAAVCVAIAIGYSLIDVRNNVLLAFLGFSVGYFALSLVAVVIELPAFIEFVLNVVLATLISLGATVVTDRLPVLNRVIAAVGGVIVLALSFFLTPITTHPIEAHRAAVRDDDTFQRAVDKLDFVPYYPTYSSSTYLVSTPKLNGYDDNAYTNETVTFLLGKAQVKQSSHLVGQDEVMNFVDNCTIYRLWFSMEDGTSIDQRDIDHSLQYPQKCNLISVTPSGKRVYFQGDNQNTRFYVKLDQTNFIIEFDDINTMKYDPNQRDEILKIIDSLQPLDKNQLEDGNSYGHGFSY